MRYKSTRGQVSDLSFTEAVLMGLASDGGLLLPESVPDVSEHLDAWQSLSFKHASTDLSACLHVTNPLDMSMGF